MKENEELYAKIEELEKELAEERIRRKITEDNSDCALWEYEIATKKYVLSRKLGRKWSTTNMVIENYQEQMHKWGFVHPDDWSVFDTFCEARTAVMSIFPMKSDKSVMNRYLSGSVM